MKKVKKCRWAAILSMSAALLLFASSKTAAAETGWERAGESWQYVRVDGTRPESQWEWIEGRWYHFDGNGVMEKGWHSSSDANWYYLHADGAMAVGWVYLDENWYYFSTDGAMYTGWLESAGDWYYLGTDGRMLAGGKTPDGYMVDSHGRWQSGLSADVRKTSARPKSSKGSSGSSSNGNSGSGWDHRSDDGATKEEEGNQLEDPAKPESDNSSSEGPDRQEPPSLEGDVDKFPQSEEDIPSISGQEAEDVLSQMLVKGKLFQTRDQEATESFVEKAVAARNEEIVLIGNGFCPFSLTLNRMEYDEIEAIQVEILRCTTEEGTYGIRIYHLEYGHQHRMTVTESPASCAGWGIWENACEVCGETDERCYLPPKGHLDEDGDRICDGCGEIYGEILNGCRQSVDCTLNGQSRKMTFVCIDENYKDGSLFLAAEVIPYGQAVGYSQDQSDYGESEIRNWLNNSFFSTLSVADHIVPVHLEECEDGFDDRVFCLSKEEMRRYAKATMTPWTEKMGQKLYWSRTADGDRYAYGVSAGGHLVSEKVDSVKGGVRPAYVLEKPTSDKNVARIWLEGERQLRRVERKEYRFLCVNADYRGEAGNRGALFVGTEECSQEEYRRIEKAIRYDGGILEWIFWEKNGKCYPAFIAEQG